TLRIGGGYHANEILSFNLDHTYDDKSSKNETFGTFSKYKYSSTDFSTKLNFDVLKAVVGVQIFDGERKNDATAWGAANAVAKDSSAVYVLGNYTLNNTLFSAGARREKIKYKYKEVGNSLNGKDNITAWDLGVNHQFSDKLSLFTNISQGFQAPDIDRFFNPGGAFNRSEERRVGKVCGLR